MKKFTKFIPSTLFKSKKKSRSHANLTSFSSSSSEEEEDAVAGTGIGSATPTTVLPTSLSSFEIYQAFQIMDRDGDGKIRKEELQALLRRFSITQEEINAMLNDVDTHGDGCISLQEFCDAIGGDDSEVAAELRETFDFFDSDGDGRITAEELFSVFKTIGEEGCTLEECRRMIAEVDSSGDGFVCFADFTRMMDPQQQQHQHRLLHHPLQSQQN